MKTGDVRDRGNGELYREVNGWTPWQYYVPEEELDRYYKDANRLMMKLERMPPAVRARLKRIEIRCPANGCLLASVYWMPSGPHQGHYLYVGRTAGGTEVYDVLNYLFFDSPSQEFPSNCLSTGGCIAYWLAGCRHGTAPIDHADMDDMLALAARIYQPAKTEEAIARLPERLRPSWGKRVFHPEPKDWRPKDKRTRPSPQQPRSPRVTGPTGAPR